MKVKDIMTKEPRTCTPETSLADAAKLMWEADCGILPVLDNGELAGVVTDRDMYIALATRNERAASLRVGAVASKATATCAPEDDIKRALTTMKDARVHRLPVVGVGNTLLGMLSINDIVLVAGRGQAVASDDVIDALHGVCAHRHAAAPHVVAA